MWFTGYPFGNTGWGVPNSATSPGIFGWFRTCDTWWSYSDLGAIALTHVFSDYHHVYNKIFPIFGASWFYETKCGLYGTFHVADDHAWFDNGARWLWLSVLTVEIKKKKTIIDI